ncbi:hypothetical protein DUNSADRAFT_4024 [Dunaliella salina]|uniref:Uncharacterized protein n=1 Tax=Dunaliella salina TaxID=3046 RepID=A0ABQ7FV05_DUNSA|nr:hypothetical protein DUNSADRAFT_4024 [Dunaliella salina]|eukprot:KAF5826234.1 hypothetical protein DUNSADRAFT_4024 [Dunaliella salina]
MLTRVATLQQPLAATRRRSSLSCCTHWHACVRARLGGGWAKCCKLSSTHPAKYKRCPEMALPPQCDCVVPAATAKGWAFPCSMLCLMYNMFFCIMDACVRLLLHAWPCNRSDCDACVCSMLQRRPYHCNNVWSL